MRQYLLFNPNAATNDTVARYIIENAIMVYCNISSDVLYIDGVLGSSYPTPKKWSYQRARNLRIPAEPYIPYYRLTDRDNIYDFISSAVGIIHPHEWISGERIQSLADVVVGDEQTLYRGNINNIHFSREMLDLNSPNALADLQRHDRVFLFTDFMPAFFAGELGAEMEGRVIITHNGDCEPENHSSILRRQFSQNARQGVGIVGIPIGIENNRWFDYRNLEVVTWSDVPRPLQIIPEKTKGVYFYFSTGTHPSRVAARDILSKKQGLEWNHPRQKREYFSELARHKYAICPRGNGLDTHRVWESLYLNTIPIVVRDDYIDAFVGLPIIVLNTWNDFDMAALPASPIFDAQNFAKITMNYWTGRIQSS